MILASASPRRRELLTRAGISFVIEPSDVDETRRADEAPSELVLRLACAKADAAAACHPGSEEVILGADTIVWQGAEVFGKPQDATDAIRMLTRLSGATHHVSTGVCLIKGDRRVAFVDTSDVRFRNLTAAEIEAYVATGEPADKAGAYAIQGGAGAFVSELVGDYDNVVGLPVTRVLTALETL